MDFQAFVNCCSTPCAVLSVEKTPAGECGDIRIICANQVYKDTMGPAYYDGMLYHELVPKDSKFEDFCFRAAFLRKRMHAYVETKALDCWTDQEMIPLVQESESLGYCQFLFEFTKEADPTRMAGVSIDTAAAIIKASITMLGAEDFRDSVGLVLDDLIERADAFACRIMIVDHQKRAAINFCERVNLSKRPEDLTGDGVLDYDIVKTWEDMIGVSNSVIIKNETEMEELAQLNPLWASSMRQYHVNSLVLIPLRRGKVVIGYLYVVNFDVSKVVEVKEHVELLAFFLGSEIANHLLMERLEELSNIDGLTGLFNHNAMLRHMRELESLQAANGVEITADTDRPAGALGLESATDSPDEASAISERALGDFGYEIVEGNKASVDSPAPQSFGIVNLDLNGLKRANDTEGHEAGDRLLVEAAEMLRKVFYEEDLYRTGGDEFIVVAAGITREAFDRKVERLRTTMAKHHSVSFAIGSCWSDGSIPVRVAFRQADANMYSDKDAFYREHPDKQRR